MRVCFTTVLSDKSVRGFLITLNSLLTSNSGFNYDVVIFEWGELSEKNKNIILKLYKKVIFKKVEANLYEKHQYDDTWRKWTYNCNYRFDVFSLKEYDKAVFFDSDIIFEMPFDNILNQDIQFGACESGEEETYQFKNKKHFNGGFLIIGKKFLNEKTRMGLIKIAETRPPVEKRLKTNNWISDQPILNTYFENKINWLSNEYNHPVFLLNNHNIKTPKNHHFVGPNKPWDSDILEEQFSYYFFNRLERNLKGRKMLMKIVINQLLSKCEKQKNMLLDIGIDIKKLDFI